MIIKKLRLQRGWSQDQLAQMAGLNIRTIQRIERGHNAGMESMKSLAAVFEVEYSTLTQESKMYPNETISSEEQLALEYVRELKALYLHVISYVFFIALLFLINYLTNPEYWWAGWAALGWGVGVASHAFSVFKDYDVFSAGWEKRQVEKRLGRKL